MFNDSSRYRPLSRRKQASGKSFRRLRTVPVSCEVIHTEVTIKPLYSVIQKDGLNFVRLYFLNYTCHVNDLHNI